MRVFFLYEISKKVLDENYVIRDMNCFFICIYK